LILAMAAYGFIASVLPVWMLLAARLPQLLHENRHHRVPGGGGDDREPRAEDAGSPVRIGRRPDHPGPLFPFAFITIACGAISGFHALTASGTTPKMIECESDIRRSRWRDVVEGLVGIVSLIAATAMFPGDYFAIHRLPCSPAWAFRWSTRLTCRRPSVRASRVGPAGGVARRRRRADLQRPARYARADGYCHFAIMFGRSSSSRRSTPGRGSRFRRSSSAASTADGAQNGSARWCRRCSWCRRGKFHLDRQHQHDLADVRHRQPAARVGRARHRTTIIINQGKARYAWVTMLPLSFVAISTMTAGVMSVRDNFWPMAIGPDPAVHFQGYVNTTLSVIMMVCVIVILSNAVWRWMQVLRGRIAIAAATS
jgi:carbon starvation protein